MRAKKESHWLIRCRQNSTVSFRGKSYPVKQLAEPLLYAMNCREIKYKGKAAYQRNAKIELELVRAATCAERSRSKPKRKRQDQEKTIKGETLPAR